jgi:hypothetical protein
MPVSKPESSKQPSPAQSSKSLLDRIAVIVGGIAAFVRKAPVAVVFIIIAIVLYFRQTDQPVENFPQFDDPSVQKEPQPPADLPEGTTPSVWMCVHRSDSQLSNGLWADIYYGMEVRLDGKMVTVKVTEKWKDLSDDKRKTVANLVVDTWIENSQALRLFHSRDEMEEVVIKRLPDDLTVANWKPATGVQLFDPQTGA